MIGKSRSTDLSFVAEIMGDVLMIYGASGIRSDIFEQFNAINSRKNVDKFKTGKTASGSDSD
jgi:hypothetical protein